MSISVTNKLFFAGVLLISFFTGSYLVSLLNEDFDDV